MSKQLFASDCLPNSPQKTQKTQKTQLNGVPGIVLSVQSPKPLFGGTKPNLIHSDLIAT